MSNLISEAGVAQVALCDVEHALRTRNADLPQVGAHVPKAAVAAVLRQGDAAAGPEMLFIRRAFKEDDPWSGHIAFPGGHAEQEDTSLAHTAMRETREETGMDLAADGRLLGFLDCRHISSRRHGDGILLASYVFAIPYPQALEQEGRFQPNSEVDELIWEPLDPMMRGHRHSSHKWRTGSEMRNMPAYDLDGHIVWGLTYRMLRTLFSLLQEA